MDADGIGCCRRLGRRRNWCNVCVEHGDLKMSSGSLDDSNSMGAGEDDRDQLVVLVAKHRENWTGGHGQLRELGGLAVLEGLAGRTRS